MPSYRVVWEIDVETEFDSPLEAAEIARAIQLDPDSSATVFTVTDSDTGEETIADLLEDQS